jgi:hypothetical protein
MMWSGLWGRTMMREPVHAKSEDGWIEKRGKAQEER